MSSISYPAYASPADEIRSYAAQTLDPSHQIVAHHVTATGEGADGWPHAGYFAIAYDGGVFARVIQAAKEGDLIHVKVEDEDQGPQQAKGMAAAVLDALTPTSSEWAAQWRTQAAREALQRVEGTRVLKELARHGGILELNCALDYQQSGPVSVVRVLPGGKWTTTDDFYQLAKPRNAWRLVAI